MIHRELMIATCAAIGGGALCAIHPKKGNKCFP